MMVKALIHHGAPAAAELWHLDDRPLLAQDAGPRQGPNRDRLVPGAESADVADQLEAGKTGVRIIGADVLDILAHAAEFGLADALARDKDLDRFDLHETDDPALDAQESVGSDDRLVNKQLHRRPVENGGFGRLSVPRIDSRDFDLLRRDVDAQRPPADLAILGAHGQQRLDRAARRARQVEAQHKAGMAGMIAAGIEPADIRPRQPVGRASDDNAADRRGDLRDRRGGQCPAIDRQARAALRGAGDAKRLDRDEDLRLRRDARRLSHFRRLAVALDLKAARRADQQIVQERVGRLLAARPALFEVKGGVEIGVRIAPFARPFLQIMDERIDIALRDIGVSRCVMFGVEKAGFSYGFVIAEQPFHPSPCLRCARNAAGTGLAETSVAGVRPPIPLPAAGFKQSRLLR